MTEEESCIHIKTRKEYKFSHVIQYRDRKNCRYFKVRLRCITRSKKNVEKVPQAEVCLYIVQREFHC